MLVISIGYMGKEVPYVNHRTFPQGTDYAKACREVANMTPGFQVDTCVIEGTETDKELELKKIHDWVREKFGQEARTGNGKEA